MNQREIKAKQIMEMEDSYSQIDIDNFSVRSQSNPNLRYIVTRTNNGLICECPDHTTRKADCKHIQICINVIKKNQCRKDNTFRIIERSLIKFCDSGNIVKAGLKKNKNSTLQRFKCTDCKKRFTVNFGFEKMRYDENTITGALQMYYSRMSTRDIANHYEMMGIEVSDVSVYNWIDKYSKMTHSYLKG